MNIDCSQPHYLKKEIRKHKAILYVCGKLLFKKDLSIDTHGFKSRGRIHEVFAKFLEVVNFFVRVPLF
jgi:hypothetical protein